MSPTTQMTIVDRLAEAFGETVDLTPAGSELPHILLPKVELPDPWAPSRTRALTIWNAWPAQRPEFVIDVAVVGENGQPPRSSNEVLRLGTSWRQFSFAFVWSGDDPARAVRLWLGRFTAERS
jgi:hypothetical protein